MRTTESELYRTPVSEFSNSIGHRANRGLTRRFRYSRGAEFPTTRLCRCCLSLIQIDARKLALVLRMENRCDSKNRPSLQQFKGTLSVADKHLEVHGWARETLVATVHSCTEKRLLFFLAFLRLAACVLCVVHQSIDGHMHREDEEAASPTSAIHPIRHRHRYFCKRKVHSVAVLCSAVSAALQQLYTGLSPPA